MHVAIPTRADFAELQGNVQRIGAIERRRRRAEFLAALRDMTPALLDAAEAVETSWLELPDELQSSLVATKRIFDDRMRAATPVPKNLIERTKRWALAISLLSHEAEIRDYAIASARFVGAVSRALAHEGRQRRIADELEAADSEAIATITTGQDEYASGAGVRLSQSEYLKRFNFR